MPASRVGSLPTRLLLAALLLAGPTAACGLTSASPTIVMVDSSLATVAPGLEAAYEALRADHEVDIITAPVHTLLQQILGGVPGDVVIGPGPLAVDAHIERGLLRDAPVVLAEVQIAIVLPQSTATSRPAALEDLVGRRIVIPTTAHPVGREARELLLTPGASDPGDLIADIASEEPDGPSVVGRVLAGGVDGGIALLPDALRTRGVRASVPDGADWVMPIEAAVLTEAADPFVEFLATTQAQQILRDGGFEGP